MSTGKTKTGESGARTERLRRRTHKNSKDGCSNCRTLRIKCNEDLPSCSHCIKRGYRCGYLDLAPERLNYIRKKNELLKKQVFFSKKDSTQTSGMNLKPDNDSNQQSSPHQTSNSAKSPPNFLLPAESKYDLNQDKFFDSAPIMRQANQAHWVYRDPRISQFSGICQAPRFPQAHANGHVPVLGPSQISPGHSLPYSTSYGLISPQSPSTQFPQPIPQNVLRFVPVIMVPTQAIAARNSRESASTSKDGHMRSNE